jgi:polyphosphate kinase 2
MTDIIIDGVSRNFELDNPALPDWIGAEAFRSGGYEYGKKLNRAKYEKTLINLQIELVKMQAWLQDTGERIVMVFEGRDAAGKGGTINAFRAYMNHRHARTIALSKPTETERGQWYYQRYVSHFPTDGDLVMFDRSWYNRAGVEPVMGFCSEDQHQKFLQETPDFEKMIVREGIHFFKIWLNVGQEMQLKRFHDRRHNPLKAWKLSPIDLKALDKWDDYTNARDAMLNETHSAHAPWTIVRSNDKRRARINAIRHVLNEVPYKNKDKQAIGKIDDKIVGSGPAFFNSFGA